MSTHLKKVFLDTCARCSPSTPADPLWNKIEQKYSHSKRYYHNLNHLSGMLGQLEQCYDLIHEWNCVVFALVYHDFVYKTISKNNEEQSAEEAKKKLTLLQLMPSQISLVSEMILATKAHEQSINNDVNLFTDADLSILGSPREEYAVYIQQIRKEYSIYPDILYKPGRKRVLNHFLDLPSIFKTTFFRDRLEEAARENLMWELRTL